MNDDWLTDHRDTLDPDEEVSEFVRLFRLLHEQVAAVQQTEQQLLKVLYEPSES